MKLIIRTAEEIAQEQSRIAEEAARARALAYLASTDWMITRQMETGKAVPGEVLQNRAAARNRLSASPGI